MLACYRRGTRSRVLREVVRHRIAWAEHAKALRSESQFTRYYRMSYESFERLLNFVSPFLDTDELQALRRTSGRPALTKAGQLQACLRWLAGGSALDIRIITGVSKSSFYRIVHRVMDAINVASELAIKFPTTSADVKAAAAAFTSRSTAGVIEGCIGAIDGWLCPIRVPCKDECGRVDSFFSGHYQRYGMNVQASVDADCRFTAYTVACPGGMNDSVAFRKWALSELLGRLEPGYFVVADNAYTQTVRVMTPYNKSEIKNRDDRDNYNFYLSQLRIRVEMAFGLLVNKWRILKTPLSTKLASCAKIIGACMRLHNFCISERLVEERVEATTLLREVRQGNEDRDISYSETVEDEDDEVHLNDTTADVPRDGAETIVFDEIARSNLVDHIAALNMHRPTRNVIRRENEQQAADESVST